MNALEAMAHEARTGARDTYQAELSKLQAQSRLASERFAEFKLAREESWDKAVLEMERIRDAFLHSFNYFESQI